MSMTDIDLTALTTDELSDLLSGVADEQIRRQRLATIPAQIREMAYAYVEGGGDPSALTLEPQAPPQAPVIEIPTVSAEVPDPVGPSIEAQVEQEAADAAS